MSGDTCRTKNIEVEVQENGIIRDSNGWLVAVAGFFYAIGTDVGEASVLNQQCAAMCNVPESIRP